MKRRILCVLLCLCMCVGMIAMSGCGKKNSEKKKSVSTTDSLKTPPISDKVLDSQTEYTYWEYTYEVEGVMYPVRQVKERKFKESFSSTATVEDVYGPNYTVSVRFDANGGQFEPGSSVLVDAYDIVKLAGSKTDPVKIVPLAPDDERRNTTEIDARTFVPTYNGHVLVGWYRDREQVGTNEEGSPIYRYGEKWRFDENQSFTVDPNSKYDVTDPVLTLYAVWQPLALVEYYDVAHLDEPLDTRAYLIGSQIQLPVRNEETGEVDTCDFPRRAGFTIQAVYYDAEKTRLVTGATITHPAMVNADGEAENLILKLYVEYVENR